MKILTVVYSFGKGGTERAAQNFAAGYSALGCDSRILCTRLDGPRKETLKQQGIPVYLLEKSSDCKEIRAWRPEVVHIHSHGILLGEFNKVHSLCYEAKFVETNVFSEPSPWSEHLLISYQLSQWCNWLFSSRSNHRYRSEILPYPVDTGAFYRSSLERRSRFRSKHGLHDSDIVIGRVGQNFEGKWSTVLIDIFEEIREKTPSLKLLLVNPPPRILKRAGRSRFSANIVHIGSLDNDIDLADCYSAMDIFVLIAEQGESFGMVISESLLCETPVVTMATPWADNSQGEVVGNCIGGYVAATKHQLRGLIEELLFDEMSRVKMGRAGRERTINMFDYIAVSKKSIDLINSSEYQASNIRSPSELIKESIGPVNAVSRMIVQSGRFSRLLKYTLGYSPWHELLLADMTSAILRRVLPGIKILVVDTSKK
jgi:glycosyltransferase involved in cell wall biosynthesis